MAKLQKLAASARPMMTSVSYAWSKDTLPDRQKAKKKRNQENRKNANTARKELEELARVSSLPLYILEAIAAYFYSMGEAMRRSPDATLPQIAGYFEKAARVAGMAAPYRHGKLSMIKLAGDPNIGMGPFKADATLEELKAELGKRVLAMAEAGLIDVASLPQPENSATAAQSVGAK